ncbi:MAG: hypothetical protein ACK41F_05530 [Fimbriimonadaceae bacterium]
MSIDWKAVSLGGLVATVTMPSFLRPELWVPAAGACLLAWMGWRLLHRPVAGEVIELNSDKAESNDRAA